MCRRHVEGRGKKPEVAASALLTRCLFRHQRDNDNNNHQRKKHIFTQNGPRCVRELFWDAPWRRPFRHLRPILVIGATIARTSTSVTAASLTSRANNPLIPRLTRATQAPTPARPQGHQAGHGQKRCESGGFNGGMTGGGQRPTDSGRGEVRQQRGSDSSTL